MKRSFWIIALVFLLTAVVKNSNGQDHATPIKILKVGGAGRWDYLAVHKQNLYISHGGQVNVINRKNGDPVAIISGTNGVHGIAFVPEVNKGYISDGKSDQVTVFDLTTNKIIDSIATGKDPDAIMYEPYSKTIITCNGHSKDLSIIDPKTDKVLATIDLGGKPETAVSDEKGKIYVNIEDQSKIAQVDINSRTVLNRWSISPAEGPSGLAIDLSTNRLFSGCDNKLLAVMDATTGKIIATPSIGEGCDGVVFDPKTKNVYSANGEGTITVIHEDSKDNFQVARTISTKKGARTIAIDEKSHTLYLPTAEFGKADPAVKRTPTLADTFQILVVPGE